MKNMVFMSRAIEIHKSMAVYSPRVVKLDC